MEPLIFHVDVNSAYLSWEAARRVANGEPDIRLIPSAIGGDRQTRTGVILAKSIAAKKYQVQTGEPVALALRKCPQLYLAKPDFRLYEQNSRAFMNICRKYAPVVEKFSIDECFLDMSGTGQLYSDPRAIASRIKDEIRDTLGFTVNIGIGPNKLLAKMASDFEKPDKIHTLFLQEIPQKLWPLPVGSLFTVGRATAQRLEKGGIFTIGGLAHADVSFVQALIGKKLGQQLHAYANGIDQTPVLSKPGEAKGYSNSTTLARDVRSEEEATCWRWQTVLPPAYVRTVCGLTASASRYVQMISRINPINKRFWSLLILQMKYFACPKGCSPSFGMDKRRSACWESP